MRLTYPEITLHEVLRATTAKDPDKVAIVFGDRILTFADLDAESNRLANGLRQLGLENGDRLGLYLPNCPEFEIGFYAACKLGAVACPLNSAYREREVTYQQTVDWLIRCIPDGQVRRRIFGETALGFYFGESAARTLHGGRG